MTQKRPSNFIDMTGRQIGLLTVIEVDEEETEKHSYFDGVRMRRRVYWKCQCNCEKHTIISVLGQNLRNGNTQSCGCYNKERNKGRERLKLQKDMTGQIINAIQVISKNLENKNNGAIHWNCKCLLCKRNFVIDGRYLRGKNANFSCGCLRSKGEFKINQILQNENIVFQTQYTFSDLPNRFFDFYLPNYNLLIEYDGEQHFNKNSRYYSEEGIERDKEKNKYCLNNNLLLYRIPYWDYDKLTDYASLIQEKYLIKEVLQ